MWKISSRLIGDWPKAEREYATLRVEWPTCDSFWHLCYAMAPPPVGDVLSLLGWITRHSCISKRFIRCIGTTTHVCIQCQWQYRWIKERTPLNINFSLQNIFSCAWFPYFFVCSRVFQSSQICRVYDRDMCVKRISTILSDSLRLLTSYRTRWSRESISIQFHFAFVWQSFCVQMTNENLHKREYISFKASSRPR